MAKEKKVISSKICGDFQRALSRYRRAVDGRSDAKLKGILNEMDALNRKAWKHLYDNYYFQVKE